MSGKPTKRKKGAGSELLIKKIIDFDIGIGLILTIVSWAVYLFK